MEFSNDELLIVGIFLAECSLVEMLAIVVDEFGEGGNLEVLSDMINDSLFLGSDIVV